MIYELEEMEVGNDIELEEEISKLSSDVVIGMIIDQIHNLDSSSDFLNNLETRYHTIENLTEDGEVLSQAKQAMVSIYNTIIVELAQAFNIFINVDDSDYEQISHTARILYTFLVVDSRKNITRLIINYLERNKKRLVEPYIEQKKKDISSSVFKKMTKNKEDMLLLMNFHELYDEILAMGIDNEMVIDYHNNSYEAASLTKLINSDTILGDVMKKMIEDIRLDYDLYTNISNKVFKKIQKRVIKRAMS